jgi:hypothetical protein
MRRKKILYICGSMNQTTMMHKISNELSEYDNYFTPFYADGNIMSLANAGFLDFSILGGQIRKNTIQYLKDNILQVDFEGQLHKYDLVFTCTDLIVQKNIRNNKIILVQEGITDAENILFQVVKRFKLPRYLAGTAATGLSDVYEYFCVASEGYREFFIKKGLKKDKLVVTGIPNFDYCSQHLVNNFPYRNYVLAATSNCRETFRYENRKKFIEKCLRIAEGRQLIFKLHPNEKVERAKKEIDKYASGSIILTEGNTNHMIANSDVLITRFSSVVYVGLALGKEVYSDFNLELLKKLTPLQNKGTSARNIADMARGILDKSEVKIFRLPTCTSKKRRNNDQLKILKIA